MVSLSPAVVSVLAADKVLSPYIALHSFVSSSGSQQPHRPPSSDGNAPVLGTLPLLFVLCMCFYSHNPLWWQRGVHGAHGEWSHLNRHGCKNWFLWRDVSSLCKIGFVFYLSTFPEVLLS